MGNNFRASLVEGRFVSTLFSQGVKLLRSIIRMEARYLKENLGCLSTCLKEVAERRPHDPIEYIAFWLKKHIEIQRRQKNKEEEAKELQKQVQEAELERERRLKRIEEARRLAEEEERRKAEEEKRQREATSASKLPVVEEKEEPSDAPAAEGETTAETTGPTEESSAEQTTT